MHALRVLDVGENLTASLEYYIWLQPRTWLQALRVLDVGENRLESLPESVVLLRQLRELLAASNELRRWEEEEPAQPATSCANARACSHRVNRVNRVDHSTIT